MAILKKMINTMFFSFVSAHFLNNTKYSQMLQQKVVHNTLIIRGFDAVSENRCK